MTKKRNTPNPKASIQVSTARRRLLFGLGAVAVIGGSGAMFLRSTQTMAEEVVVYKDPSCECCGRWEKHMRQNGFNVVVNDVEDMGSIKARAGIPEALESCHTAYVGGYLVEGHVPSSDIKRMLSLQPALKGLAVPGMPMSAPGMDSPGEPFTVLAFDAKGGISVFASY